MNLCQRLGPSGRTVYTRVHCTTMYDYVLTIIKHDKSWMINGFLKAGRVFITEQYLVHQPNYLFISP